MAERVERVETPADREIVDARATRTATTTAAGPVVLARVIWFIAGVLLVLLAFRFIFALLGANPNNGLARFVFDTSHPFVMPFFNLFSYNEIRTGASRFEIFTLVAMAVYAVIAWGLAYLATIGHRNRAEV
jgi:hypothetical protein